MVSVLCCVALTKFLHPATSEFVEGLLVERLRSVLGPHGQEDVTANKLVDNLAVGRDGREDNLLRVKLDHHLFHLPVDPPGLHGVEPPGLDVVPGAQVHAHEPVGRDAQQLVPLLLLEAVEPDDEEGDAVVGQGLPGTDVVHLCLAQAQVLDVGVSFHDPGHQLARLARPATDLLQETRRDVLFRHDLSSGWQNTAKFKRRIEN